MSVRLALSTPFLVLVLAALYWATARAGMFMALPSGYSTIFWPASGFAFAFVYRFGYRLLAGVFLGCLAFNLSAYYAVSDPDNLHVWLLNGLGNAVGAALQAFAGVWLVRRFVGTRSRLEELYSILKFSLLAGPVSCLASATVGIGTLLLTGSMPVEAAPYTWVTWYVGDTLGVLVFAPALALLLSGKQISNLRKSMVILPLILVFALVVALFFYVRGLDEKSEVERFNATTDLVFQQLQVGVYHHMYELDALKSFFHASESVEETEFDTFLKKTFVNNSGIVSMGWIPRVQNDARANFEQYDLGGRPITQVNESGDFVPASEAGEYYPILFLAPMGRATLVIGFDLASESRREAALAKARRTGQISATEPITLVGGRYGPDRWAFLAFNPIYSHKNMPATEAEREATLSGYVHSVFLYDEIFQPVIDLWRKQGIGLRVLEFNASKEGVYVFDTFDRSKFYNVELSIQRALPMEVAGRTWVLEFYKEPQFLLTNVNWSVWGALAGGLMFAFFASLFLLEVTGQTAVVEGLVREKTRELRRSNKELQDFAYVASHDLKAPLRHVSLSVGFLKDRYADKLDEQGHKFLETMVQSTDRMQKMIESLLSYSRVGQKEKEFEAVSLSEVLGGVCASMKNVLDENKVIVEGQGLPEVMGDESLLSQLLQNLIQNSIKYAKEGVPAVIKLDAVQREDKWEISVADNGIGIDPAYKDKIFQIFQRLHGDQDYDGVGIGLSICQRIVEFHDGKIWLDAGYKNGTKFVFTLRSPHLRH